MGRRFEQQQTKGPPGFDFTLNGGGRRGRRWVRGDRPRCDENDGGCDTGGPDPADQTPDRDWPQRSPGLNRFGERGLEALLKRGGRRRKAGCA